jgi:hypothetical protein
MQVIEKIQQTSTYLKITYISRPDFSFVISWLGTGIFLCTIGVGGLWYVGSQLLVTIQIVCPASQTVSTNCQLNSATLVQQRSQPLVGFRTLSLQQSVWIENNIQLVLETSQGKVKTIFDYDRKALEKFAQQVNTFLQQPQKSGLTVTYSVWWKAILYMGFVTLWLGWMLLIMPAPLLEIQFRFTYMLDRQTGQLQRLSCALLRQHSTTWLLEEIQAVQLDEETIEDDTFHLITLVLKSGDRCPLISWRQLPLHRIQLTKATHKINQFLINS